MFMAEELEDALLDLSLAVTRLSSTSARRHSLDEVLERFGFTREELLDLMESRKERKKAKRRKRSG